MLQPLHHTSSPDDIVSDPKAIAGFFEQAINTLTSLRTVHADLARRGLTKRQRAQMTFCVTVIDGLLALFRQEAVRQRGRV